LAPNAEANGEARPGVRVLGQDPETGDEITLRTGRFGDYVQRGEGEKPKRCSLPKGLAPADVTLEKAIALLALPREVAKHPTSGEPIVAGIGRFGSYVQHGKTYANLGREDDVLEVGGNRAIDLIVAKESGASQPRFGQNAGRALGDHPTEGGAVTVRRGRFGSYVNHGKINATLPRDMPPESVTLEDAVAMLAAKAAGGGGPSGRRLVGDHPEGGAITVRPGRFGAYVNWGKVNATIPKSIPPESVTLADALELIGEREAKPGKAPAKARATKATAKAKAPKAAAEKAEPTAKAKVKAQAKPKPKPRAAAAKTPPAAEKRKAKG
jgi:DNA topoisomerase-1